MAVEFKDGVEISYMTAYAYNKLIELRKTIPFVPVTARKMEEAMRITFIKNDVPEWMICENGRSIYRNGVRWEEWDRQVERHLSLLKNEIAQAQSYFRYMLGEKLKCRVWHINQDMVMAKTENLTKVELSEILDKESWFLKHGCSLFVQERKVYLIPTMIKKERAIQYLIDLLKPTLTLSAGDSNLDQGMMNETAFCIAPRHHTMKLTTIPVTKESGIIAGEEIVLYANEKLCSS